MSDALMDRIKAHRSAPTVYDPPTFEQMADRIEELESEVKQWHSGPMAWIEKWGAAEAKLDKAAEALREIERYSNYNNSLVSRTARTILAELEGRK